MIRRLVMTAAIAALSLATFGMELPDFKTIKLDNGMTVILMEKHDVPLIAFHGRILGGDLADPAGKAGTAALTAELLSKGAGERDASEFSLATDGVGGNFATTGGTEALIVRGEFMARDSKLMMELLTDVLIRPTFDAEEFEKARKRNIDQLTSAKDNNPGGVIGAYFDAALYGDHPYGRTQSEASLGAIKRDDVVKFFKDHVGADRAILALVGDFDTSAMEKTIRSSFGKWGKAKAELPKAAKLDKVKGRSVLLVDKPDATQTYFRIGNIASARNYPNSVVYDMVNTAFGGRFTSMLNSELRIKSGLTYGARSVRAEEMATGSVAIYSYTKTETTGETIDLAIEVLGTLHKDGIDGETLDSIKAYVQGQYPPRLETGTQLASKLSEIEAYGLGRGDVDDFAAKVQSASADDAKKVIAELYPKEDLVFVLVGNAEAIREAAKKYGEVTEMKITDQNWTPE